MRVKKKRPNSGSLIPWKVAVRHCCSKCENCLGPVLVRDKVWGFVAAVGSTQGVLGPAKGLMLKAPARSSSPSSPLLVSSSALWSMPKETSLNAAFSEERTHNWEDMFDMFMMTYDISKYVKGKTCSLIKFNLLLRRIDLKNWAYKVCIDNVCSVCMYCNICSSFGAYVFSSRSLPLLHCCVIWDHIIKLSVP